jgi:DNA-directed RNA polymerase sigma subunit (sigma70/sigma32)
MNAPRKRLDKTESFDKTNGIKYNMTLCEVAKRMGITRERVLQIEKRALRKLKKQFDIDLEDLL